MAYISQELKKKLAPGIKKVLSEYGLKGTISIRNYSTLRVTIREGKLDLIAAVNADNQRNSQRTGMPPRVIEDYYQANPYRASTDYSDKKVGEFFAKLVDAMKGNEWYDRSDAMTDYFDTAYYLSIDVGKWDKPYRFTGESVNEAA